MFITPHSPPLEEGGPHLPTVHSNITCSHLPSLLNSNTKHGNTLCSKNVLDFLLVYLVIDNCTYRKCRLCCWDTYRSLKSSIECRHLLESNTSSLLITPAAITTADTYCSLHPCWQIVPSNIDTIEHPEVENILVDFCCPRHGWIQGRGRYRDDDDGYMDLDSAICTQLALHRALSRRCVVASPPRMSTLRRSVLHDSLSLH